MLHFLTVTPSHPRILTSSHFRILSFSHPHILLFLYLCVMGNKHAQQICHPGVVEQVKGHEVLVRIESQAACGKCQANSYCGMGESTDKAVEVDLRKSQGTFEPDDFHPGQHVEVILSRGLGYRALLMGYMLPFLILLTTLIVMFYSTGNEGLSALVALLLMVPYYGLLYHYRQKLRQTFHFSIRPLS